jgi:cytochrome oxidase assembly protein ShyY1
VNRYAFLRSPLWIAGIVLALVGVVLFVNLGLWQLRRLDERRAMNTAIIERSDEEPVDLGSLVATHGRDPDALAFRRVSVSGRYDPEAEVLRAGTTGSRGSGNDVVTPLFTDELAIAVDRGWVPIEVEGPPVVTALPPQGLVDVVGVLLPGETAGSLGTPDGDGLYATVGRIDLVALAPQWGGDVLPVYLLLETQDPPGAELPVPRAAPEPSEGPHLSYAIQWFVFAAIVLIGFPVLVYRTAPRAEKNATMVDDGSA